MSKRSTKGRKKKLSPVLAALYSLLAIIALIFGTSFSPELDFLGIQEIIQELLDDGTDDQGSGNNGGTYETLEGFLSEIPEYSDAPYVIVNKNTPFFEASDIEKAGSSYESYSELDALGRCGVCIASVGKDIMPTEDRGEIGSVKPSGWVQKKYAGLVEGNYLYNRCHLIGYQLTGENANSRNLITGTRYLNVDGMLPFENLVADHVKETGDHVLYRVTPIYSGSDLVAKGVLMEALSIEDGGEEVQFCVFCYNVQPGIVIDYTTGDSRLK